MFHFTKFLPIADGIMNSIEMSRFLGRSGRVIGNVPHIDSGAPLRDL